MGRCYPERHPRVSFPIVAQPEDLGLMSDKTQFLIDKTMVARKWQALDKTTGCIIPPCYDAVNGQAFLLNQLFSHFEAISVKSPFAMIACFQGGAGDGHLQFFAEAEGKKEDMLKGLEVKHSAAGFVESLYLAFHLPTKYAYGHGLYGRNYTLLPSFHVLRHQRHSRFPPEGLRGKLDRPSGIRVVKRRGKFYVSCIAVYDFGSIVDFTVRVVEGKATALWPPDVIFESGERIMY